MKKIHFDFIVDEADAEFIFSGVDALIENTTLSKLEINPGTSDYSDLISWYYSHIEYLKDLKAKMYNRPFDVCEICDNTGWDDSVIDDCKACR